MRILLTILCLATSVSARAENTDYQALEEIFASVQEDLVSMSESSKEVVDTTVNIGRMMIKMRTIDAKIQQKKISDDNSAVQPNGRSLEQLKEKFEEFKDEHWSRFAIPNFEYRFFKRDRDLVTVTNPESLKKILMSINQARAQFMPTKCFDQSSQTFIKAPICERRLALCGQSGYESLAKKLVAFKLDQELILQPVALEFPEDAEEVLGVRYDTTSDRATLLSDEVFYFCKLAATHGASFKSEPYFYPSEVAHNQ